MEVNELLNENRACGARRNYILHSKKIVAILLHTETETEKLCLKSKVFFSFLMISNASVTISRLMFDFMVVERKHLIEKNGRKKEMGNGVL